MPEELIKLLNENPVIGYVIVAVIGLIVLIIAFKLLKAILKIIWLVLTSPFRRLFGGKKDTDSGKPTSGGWGRVIDGGDRDHITATYDKARARVGDGFHISTDGARTYFDNQGRCLGSGRKLGKLLEKLNAQWKRGVISEQEYQSAIDSLAARNK